MRKKLFWFLESGLLIGFGLLLSACGSTPTETVSPLPSPSATPSAGEATSTPAEKVTIPPVVGDESKATVTPTVEAGSESSKLSPQAAALVKQAKEDLSTRLQIAADDVILESVEAVQWRDSSLGCPRPGMNYLMVITPGYLIKLKADGKTYEYHTSQNHVSLCDKTTSLYRKGEKPEQHLVEVARVDLSQRSGIPADKIQVVSVEYVRWPDASLGCPKPGMMYIQVETLGYRIILSAQGREYDYRASEETVFLCEQ